MPAALHPVVSNISGDSDPTVGPSGARRSRQGRGAVLLVLLAALVMLAGCSSAMRQPTDYGEINAKGEGFYGNFMYGCTGVQPTDGKYSNPKLGSENFCKCIFTGLKKTVDFSDVRDFEAAQAEAKDGEMPKVPKGIERVRSDCAKKHSAES